jgi:hypothetical protein
MDVCFKNVRNRHLLLVGELQVAANVRTRIEHGSYTFGIVADQIGKLGDTVRLNAFKNECHKGSYLSGSGLPMPKVKSTPPCLFHCYA